MAAAISIGFHKVSGIDLDKEGLQNATVACNEISKRFNNSDFEIDNIDAATYDIPNSINVIFMFNPFGKKTMIEVIKISERVLNYHRGEFALFIRIRFSKNCFMIPDLLVFAGLFGAAI